MADMKKNTAITSDRMFFGALVNAYSSPVIEAKISLNATKTYLRREGTMRKSSGRINELGLTIQFESKRSEGMSVHAYQHLCKTRLDSRKGWSIPNKYEVRMKS